MYISKFFLLVVNQRILNLGSLCWLLSLCRRKKRCLLPRADHLTKPRYVNMINWKDDGQHCIYTCMLLYTYSSSVDINLYETSLGNVIQLAFGKLDDVSGTSFLTFQEQVSWRFRNKFLDVSGTSFLECKCVQMPMSQILFSTYRPPLGTLSTFSIGLY